MQIITSNNVIEKIKQLTGWNKTKIANDIFDIPVSDLGNRTREDRINFNKLYEWSERANIYLYFNWLIDNGDELTQKDSDNFCFQSTISSELKPSPHIDNNSLMSMANRILESETLYANNLKAIIESFHQGLQDHLDLKQLDRRKKYHPDKIPPSRWLNFPPLSWVEPEQGNLGDHHVFAGWMDKTLFVRLKLIKENLCGVKKKSFE